MNARRFGIWAALALWGAGRFAVPGWAGVPAELPVFSLVAGEIRTITVRRGDTLLGIAARTGVPVATIARTNGIADPNRLWPGQELRVDTRRIVPALLDEGWVINVPEAELYVFENGVLAARYPVGLGRPSRPTPLGSFRILYGEKHPSWEVPPSIQEEMRREGKVVRRKVAPGPDNPLGPYWIQLSIWGYGIHGTPFPASVGQFLSHGCVRLRNGDIAELFPRAAKGTRVEIAYLPVKVAVTPKGGIWVEAHADVYRLGSPGADAVLAALERAGVDPQAVDRGTLDRILAERDGVAHPVGNVAASREAGGSATGPDADDAAFWRCLDCPPAPGVRRVTFQIEARAPIDLPNPYPLEIRDDSGRVVFRPQMVAQAMVHLAPGETRNFVWEMRDTTGQPLPPGSYTAVVRFYRTGEDRLRRLYLPLWVSP